MALNINCLEIDCMQGTIFLVYYLLFKFNYLLKIDASKSFKLLINSENNNNTVILNKNQYTNIQSAENCFPAFKTGKSKLPVPAFMNKDGNRNNGKGFSETIRQLSNYTKSLSLSNLEGDNDLNYTISSLDMVNNKSFNNDRDNHFYN
jgi:hypothetical protein